MAAENFASRRDNSKILTARKFLSRRKSRQDSHRGLAAKLPAEISISRRDITSRSRRVLAAEISVSRRVFACRDFHISLRSRRDRGAFLAAEISRISARIATRSRRVFGRRDFPHLGENRDEIAARFWPPRFPASRRESRRDRGAFLAAEISRISARIAARSRRVFGRRDFPHLGENRGEIAASFWPPRFPVSRRDLAVISAVISARWGNLGGQKRAAISPRSRRDSRRDRGEISARSRKNFHEGTDVELVVILVIDLLIFTNYAYRALVCYKTISAPVKFLFLAQVVTINNFWKNIACNKW